MMSCRLVLFMMWIGVNCMGLPRNSVYMVKYLGLKEEKVPFKVDAQFSDFILQEIFEGGNFGKKKLGYREKSKGMRRKLLSVYYFYMRCKLYKPLMPKEAGSYFWKKISLNFRLMTKHHY